MEINDNMNNQSVHQDQEVVDSSSNAALESLQNQYLEMRAKYMQLLADVENMKKRALRDQEVQKDALTTILFADLLAVVDNFERALAQKGEGQDALYEGLSLIHASFLDVLKKWNVVQMSNYQQFDPLFHEALMQVEQEGAESGSIAQVLQKGYMINGKVLRPAKVSVVK